MDKVNQFTRPLNKYAEKVPQIVEISKKAGVEPGVLLGAALLVSSLVIIICFGWVLLTVIMTVVYPSVKSIQALETKDTDEDDKYWLTYWILFGIFTLLDSFGGIVLNFIPFYPYLKLLFFIYLMHPKTQGAAFIYSTFVKPILSQHKDKIQRFIDEIKGSGMEAMS